jgi:hypothetical protein
VSVNDCFQISLAYVVNFRRSDEWHEAYDCQLQSEIVFQIHAHLLPADNPQQAESNSNAGANANLWCRGDNSGGTDEFRESDEGYHALFEVRYLSDNCMEHI